MPGKASQSEDTDRAALRDLMAALNGNARTGLTSEEKLFLFLPTFNP